MILQFNHSKCRFLMMINVRDKTVCAMFSGDTEVALRLNEPRFNHIDRITVEKQKPVNLLNSCVLLDRRGYSFLIY